MPAVKKNLRNIARHSNERLELLDQLLFKYKHIPDREYFLKLINSKLPHDGQVSLSTLDKDIKNLRDMLAIKHPDISLEFNKESGFYYSEKGFSFYRNSINDEDKTLLELAKNLFIVFKGTPLQGKFSEIVGKVMADSLTGSELKQFTETTKVQLVTPMTEKGIEWIEPLLEAIFSQTALEMNYKAKGKGSKKKIISPYLLKQHSSRWYVVAYDLNCDRKEKTSIFSLDSIQSLEISNKPYFKDPDFNTNDFFKYSLGIWQLHDQDPREVVLEFNKLIDFVKDNPIHHSQKTSYDKEKNLLTVSFTVYLSPELEMLIQSFGTAVKVISPQELADKIMKIAGEVFQLYKN